MEKRDRIPPNKIRQLCRLLGIAQQSRFLLRFMLLSVAGDCAKFVPRKQKRHSLAAAKSASFP